MIDFRADLVNAKSQFYPLATKLALVGAALEFIGLAAWMLTEKYVLGHVFDWAFKANPWIFSFLVLGAMTGMFVTPVLLVRGLFQMSPSDWSLSRVAAPFMWHVFLAISGLSLPCIFSAYANLGNYWTIVLAQPIYVVALSAWNTRRKGTS